MHVPSNQSYESPGQPQILVCDHYRRRMSPTSSESAGVEQVREYSLNLDSSNAEDIHSEVLEVQKGLDMMIPP